MARVAATAQSAERRDGYVVALASASVLGLLSLAGASVQAQAMDEGAVVLGIAGVIAAVALVAARASVVPRHRLGIAWTAFLAWALVSTLASSRVWASLVGEVTNLLGWLAFAAFTGIVLAVAGRGVAARRALLVVAPVVVFGQTAATLVQLALSSTPRGSLPNSTYLGEAVLLLLPFVLEEDAGGLRLGRPQRVGLAVSAVIVLAAAGSRVAAVVGAVWLVWALVSRSRARRSVRIVLAVALIGAVVLAGLVFARGEVLGSMGVSTLGERPQMWRAAALAVAERPLLGFGPDGFVAGGVAVTTPELAAAGPVLVFRPGAVDPHSLPVWVAVSTGLIGLALFLWSVIELGIAWRARILAGTPVQAGVWAAGMAGAVFCTAPLALQVVPLLAFVLGVTLMRPPGATAVGGDSRSVAFQVTNALIIAALGIASLVFALNTGTRLVLEVHGPEVSPQRVTLAQSATDVWRLDPHLAHLASLHWGWAAAADPTIAVRQPDLVAIERAVAVDERDPFVALERARTLRFYGAPAAAIESAFLDTFARWSLYPVARAEYAILLAQVGQDAEARKQIAIAELVVDDDQNRIKAIEAAKAELSAGE